MLCMYVFNKNNLIKQDHRFEMIEHGSWKKGKYKRLNGGKGRRNDVILIKKFKRPKKTAKCY